MENAKVTVILYPDDDGGYTAVMPYFFCHLTTQGNCLTAQGETPEEAMAEARSLLQAYLAWAGAEGSYHLGQARLEGLEVRELEVEAGD